MRPGYPLRRAAKPRPARRSTRSITTAVPLLARAHLDSVHERPHQSQARAPARPCPAPAFHWPLSRTSMRIRPASSSVARSLNDDCDGCWACSTAFAHASQTASTASAATPSSTPPRCEPRAEHLAHLDEAVLGRRKHEPEIVDARALRTGSRARRCRRAARCRRSAPRAPTRRAPRDRPRSPTPLRRAGAGPRRAASHDARRGRPCRARSSSPARAATSPASNGSEASTPIGSERPCSRNDVVPSAERINGGGCPATT